MLYYLIIDPTDIAIMQPQGLFWWSLYSFTEQKRPVPKCVHHDSSAISDLSCYITLNLQHTGRERKPTGQESLTTAILNNLLFDDKR